MKKIITLLLALAGMVSTASAWDRMFLKNNLSGWDTDGYEFTGSNDGSQDVYELTLTPTIVALANDGDIYFRPNHWSTHGERNPSDGKDFTYLFTENGQNQTYGPTGKGTNGAFVIPHSTIKANSYKITVYFKYNDSNKFYIKVEIVDMPVTIGSTGKATYFGDRALDFTDMDVSAYTITGSTKATGALTAAKQTTVPANTGLYLEGDAATYNVPVIANFDASENATITGNMLKGSVTQIDNLPQIDDDFTNYILTINTKYGDVATPKFYKVNSGGNILLANKAYLQIPTASAAREFFWFENESTGVEATLTDSNSVNGEVFDLQGRRVAQPTKGLYIVNGKKVLY